MIRFLIGLSLWWLAFPPALALLHLTYAVIVCLLPAAALCMLKTRIKPLRIGAYLLYMAGLLGMLAITYGNWLLPPMIWGGVLVMGMFAMILCDKWPKNANHAPDDNNSDSFHTLSASELLFNIKFPFKRHVIFYIIWGIGGVGIAIQNTDWGPVMLMVWSIVMLLLGYYSIWPFAILPEWIGYQGRREAFVSVSRWRMRFIVIGILMILSITAIAAYLS